MALHRRSRTLAGAVAIAVLLLAACGSDDDGRPEGLRDIRDTEPATDDANPDGPDEPEVDDDGSATDEQNGGDASAEADEPDDDPSTEDEPVTFDGVTVPDDALQINDDLDMPPEQQLEYLEFTLEASLYIMRAASTGNWEPSGLNRYFADAELEGLTGELERFEREGLRQVTNGAVLEYLRIDDYVDGEAVIHRCVLAGPDDGVVSIDTGEYTFVMEDPSWLVGMRVEPIADGEGVEQIRVVEGGGAGDATCP